MAYYLCISVTLLNDRFHGRGEDSQPEWPPSPLRLYQALIAGAAGRWNERIKLTAAVPALEWLEKQPPPTIVASKAARSGTPYRTYVPDNVADKLAASWSKGRAASIADYRSEKDVQPIHLNEDSRLHYLYCLDSYCQFEELLKECSFGLTHVGWGIDQAIASVSVIDSTKIDKLDGERWQPRMDAATKLRSPSEGTLAELADQHTAFLNRLQGNQFSPVQPLNHFDVVGYHRVGDPLPRPHVVFELRHNDGSFCRYPQRNLIHIAGMLRHLALETMKQCPPGDVGDDTTWLDSFVAGHAHGNPEHRQFSYLPLPSIGHQHADQAVRRVMITAPVGDDAWLEHLSQRLAGQQLKPESNGNAQFGEKGPPTLVRIDRDKVSRCYTASANRWASVTPVILPGHTDRKRNKTIKLIERAIREAGIEQPCTYEWSPVSRFRKSLSAHKYDRNNKPIYCKPKYLQELTAVHLELTFKEQLKAPGPLALGAGRHCGFGLMASSS